MDIFQWRNFGVSSSTEEFSITPLVTTSHQSQTYIPSISVLPKNERQHKWTFILNYYWTLLVSGKCLDEDTDHDDDGRNDHEAKKTSLDIFCTHNFLRSSSTVATGCSGRSGTLWVERSSTGTLADAWTFSKKIISFIRHQIWNEQRHIYIAMQSSLVSLRGRLCVRKLGKCLLRTLPPKQNPARNRRE